MEIDGVRVVLLDGSKQAPAIDFKEAIGFDASHPSGSLTIIGKIEERGDDGKVQKMPIQLKVYAPGTWHHAELVNPVGNKIIRSTGLVTPIGTKVH